MSYDPFGDDPDADIFRDDEEEDILEETKSEDIEAGTGHKHTLDGTECPTCGVIHPTYLTEELPSGAVEAILNFFDAMPDEFVASILESGGDNRSTPRPQAEMLTAFIGYTGRMERNNATGPVLHAIVEHLDEQTGGRISAKWRIYDTERRLIISHDILKSANTALDDAHVNEAKPHYISLLELVVDFARERLEICKQKYLDAAAVINYEPVESILEYGTYPDDEERETQQSIADDLYERLLVK